MKTMTAKFAGTCNLCNVRFAAGTTISYDGKAFHTACIEETKAAEVVDQEIRDAKQIQWKADRKAGKHAIVTMSDKEIFVRNAFDYKQAKAMAFQWIKSAQVDSGLRYTLVAKVNLRTGKRTLGRVLTLGGEYSGIQHRDGWAFEYRVHQA